MRIVEAELLRRAELKKSEEKKQKMRTAKQEQEAWGPWEDVPISECAEGRGRRAKHRRGFWSFLPW
jgi:hypothetical protein